MNNTGLEITQADRDAAADAKAEMAESWCYDCDRILEGRFDDWPLVQAFARHRLNTRSSTGERDRVVEECAKVALTIMSRSGYPPERNEVAKAIRSLKDEK